MTIDTMRVVLVLCCLVPPGPWSACAAQIYVGVDRGGTTLLSNFQTANTPDMVPGTAVAGAGPFSPAPKQAGALPAIVRETGRLASAALLTLVTEAALAYGVDARLLDAVIRVESGYDARAVSSKGALGLMQLMPDTARRFGVSDLHDPRQNLKAGALYLHWLLERFDGNLELALAGYNAGEQAVVRAGYRVPAFNETRRYVPKVLQYYRNNAS